MPGIVDKIIINDNRDRGNNKAIQQELNTLEILAAEIQELNLLKTPEAIAFKSEMELYCNAFNKAQTKYLEELRQLINKMDKFIDNNLP